MQAPRPIRNYFERLCQFEVVREVEYTLSGFDSIFFSLDFFVISFPKLNLSHGLAYFLRFLPLSNLPLCLRSDGRSWFSVKVNPTWEISRWGGGISRNIDDFCFQTFPFSQIIIYFRGFFKCRIISRIKLQNLADKGEWIGLSLSNKNGIMMEAGIIILFIYCYTCIITGGENGHDFFYEETLSL